MKRLSYTSYKRAVAIMKDAHAIELSRLRDNRKLFSIARKHVLDFIKISKGFELGINYQTYYPPSVDIDVTFKSGNKFKELYPLVDALIKDPQLDMVEALPTKLSALSGTIAKFTLKKHKGYPCLRIYVFMENSKVCVSVGTGEYKEITRIACGHYDETGQFVEDTDETQ